MCLFLFVYFILKNLIYCPSKKKQSPSCFESLLYVIYILEKRREGETRRKSEFVSLISSNSSFVKTDKKLHLFSNTFCDISVFVVNTFNVCLLLSSFQ